MPSLPHATLTQADTPSHPYVKTTIELPDDLLIEAKTTAARRRTTLRALIEQSLRRELAPSTVLTPADAEHFEISPLGSLRLKKRGVTVTTEDIKRLMADDEADEK